MIDQQTIETVLDNIADQCPMGYWPGNEFGGIHVPPPLDGPVRQEAERRAALSRIGNRIKPADGTVYMHPNDGGAVGFPELMRGLQGVDRILAEVEGLDAATAADLERLRHCLAHELVGGPDVEIEPEPLLAMARVYAANELEREVSHG
ncbi:hypothetical protein LRF89_02810 [Halorhodospira sp. 9621]|uniref:hypothetical protein n=1 Tax=Halorhodospira sp. 9621 TaxID=2899135 RepID=UPI001EE8B63C|nr:hypothetical protein [Halorhodospira sp. 9621]MCG5532367.1 hypothetical protein [Halorhodospira sp. 9621]